MKAFPFYICVDSHGLEIESLFGWHQVLCYFARTVMDPLPIAVRAHAIF